jgi:hypothetical protein
MNKINFAKLAKDTKTVLAKYSPEILTGIGVAGMVTSTVLAVRATPKALKHIEDAQYEKGDNLTFGEKVKATWKDYIPAVATGVTASACIIGASSINYKRNAALAAAYTLSETAFSEYKEKIIETIGEKKEQIIKEEIAAEKVQNTPVDAKNVIITGKGTTLCLDVKFKQYFESDIESIRRAVNNLNARLNSGEEYVSLNDFYDELGIDRIDIGEELGWNLGRDGMVEIDFGTALTKDGRPCITINYCVAPRYEYYKLM